MNNNVKLTSDIIEKIKKLPFSTETTIAELINYNPEENFIDPMEQMSILRKVCTLAEENNICLEKNMEEKGGLGFFTKFKKNESINNEFKINSNISFVDEKSKIEYQKYLDEVNEYNRKIATGEKLDKDLSAIMDEFKKKFSVERKNDGKVNNDMSEEMANNEELKISDLELGDLIINTRTGKISGEKLYYNEKNTYSEFPIEYKMNEFEINEIERCDLKEFKNLFIENLRCIFNKKNQIKERIIEKIWDWFVTNDFTLEKLKQQFLRLEISVTVRLSDENTINFNTSWEFVEEHSDINSGYADFYFDFDSNETKCSDIGFF